MGVQFAVEAADLRLDGVGREHQVGSHLRRERPAESSRRMVCSRPLSGTSRAARGSACSGCSASRTLSKRSTYFAPCLPCPPGQHQAQQARQRDAFIDEEAYVALWLGQHEGLLQGVQGLARLALTTVGQRARRQDLQLAAQPPLRPGMGAQAVEEPQGFLWLALRDQYA